MSRAPSKHAGLPPNFRSVPLFPGDLSPFGFLGFLPSVFFFWWGGWVFPCQVLGAPLCNCVPNRSPSFLVEGHLFRKACFSFLASWAFQLDPYRPLGVSPGAPCSRPPQVISFPSSPPEISPRTVLSITFGVLRTTGTLYIWLFGPMSFVRRKSLVF